MLRDFDDGEGGEIVGVEVVVDRLLRIDAIESCKVGVLMQIDEY